MRSAIPIPILRFSMVATVDEPGSVILSIGAASASLALTAPSASLALSAPSVSLSVEPIL